MINFTGEGQLTQYVAVLLQVSIRGPWIRVNVRGLPTTTAVLELLQLKLAAAAVTPVYVAVTDFHDASGREREEEERGERERVGEPESFSKEFYISFD